MTLDFVDGMTLMGLIVGTVYVIVSWQIRRCSNNVNEFNQQINALIVRQTLLAERTDVELPSMDELIQDMGQTLPGACKSHLIKAREKSNGK